MTSETDGSAPQLDRRSARREETKAEIVGAAWDLVRENGLAGLAMRELGQRVGMKAQSLYSYFGSKHEIYDAMFHEGYIALATEREGLAGAGIDPDPRAAIRSYARAFFRFCTADPVRYQLLFQRTIPDFIPSEESYAVAVAVYDELANQLVAAGVEDRAGLDLFTATLTGLTDQQISNDPGGDRWEQLLDRAVDIVLRDIAPHLFDDVTELEDQQ